MERRWTEKGVNLDLLSELVEDFFKNRGFVTKRIKSSRERTILWQSRRAAKAEKLMRANIKGKPDDFTIELRASELMNSSVRAGLLTKSLGGGYFLLKSLKTREELEKLEKEFWIYAEDKVAELALSGQNARRSSS